MAKEPLRLTMEQRLAALERENVVLRDKMKMLHGMLKQQRQLIAEFITQQIVLAPSHERAEPHVETMETAGHFLCQRRFEQLEERLDACGAYLGEGRVRRRAV